MGIGWKIFAGIFGALCIAGAIFFLSKLLSSSGRIPVGVLLFAFVFCVGLGGLLWLDTMRTLVAVTGKRISSGKSTSYYVSLSPWGRYTADDEVSVSKSFYQSVHTEESLRIFLNDGKWGVPWYRLRR